MTQSFSNSLYTDQMHLAERELSAFITSVRASYGPEEAERSAQDWIEESELMDSSPRSEVRNWRTITIAASVRLANRLNGVLNHQTALGASTTSTQVSPTPSSNCSDYTDDHTIFEEVHEAVSAERRF
jgi:hypothetical protein